MAQVTLRGNAVTTNGDLPAIGTIGPDFKLTATDLSEVSLADFAGKKKLLSINPSLDTGVCATVSNTLEKAAADFKNAAFLIVSVDTPFAQQRFCQENSCKNVKTLSMIRSKKFAKDYGILIQDGPLAGCAARSIVVLDEKNKVLYTQLLPEISEEPDYSKALQALK